MGSAVSHFTLQQAFNPFSEVQHGHPFRRNVPHYPSDPRLNAALRPPLSPQAENATPSPSSLQQPRPAAAPGTVEHSRSTSSIGAAKPVVPTQHDRVHAPSDACSPSSPIATGISEELAPIEIADGTVELSRHDSVHEPSALAVEDDGGGEGSPAVACEVGDSGRISGMESRARQRQQRRAALAAKYEEGRQAAAAAEAARLAEEEAAAAAAREAARVEAAARRAQSKRAAEAREAVLRLAEQQVWRGARQFVAGIHTQNSQRSQLLAVLTHVDGRHVVFSLNFVRCDYYRCLSTIIFDDCHMYFHPYRH